MPDTKPGTHGHQRRHDVIPPLGTSFRAGRFGRMVPELTTPFVASDDALIDLGLAMMDKKKNDAAGDNANIPAGFTYLGQFIDHDITFDTTTLTEVSRTQRKSQTFARRGSISTVSTVSARGCSRRSTTAIAEAMRSFCSARPP